jgi:ABC-type sugar transport system substrate-binding protein
VLALAQEPPSGAQVPPPLAEAPSTGSRVVVLGSDGDGDPEGERAHVVTVRFEGSALGTVELRVALDDELVHALVALGDGPGLALARERTSGLRAALAQAAGRQAEVEVVARPNPLDVYV